MTFNWDDLFISLRQEKTILFLGPELVSAPGEASLDQALSRYLGVDNSDHPYILSYLEEDGFFLFRKKKYRGAVIEQIARFYQEVSMPGLQALYEQIARLPFPMVVSLTPDLLLPQTFNRLGVDYHHDFYHRHAEARPFPAPDRHKPLLYNLLGSIEAQGSMVLTHSDLYEFLESVIRGGRMDARLRDTFLTAQQYIFLGLPFQKWYMQLLLRLLKIQDLSDEMERFAFQSVLAFRREYFEQEFKIEFVPQTPQEFIGELFQRCEKLGLLREPTLAPANGTIADFDGWRSQVGSGAFTEAAGAFKSWLLARRPATSRMLEDLLALESRYSTATAEYRGGRIDFREYELRFNNLNSELLRLLAEAEKLQR